MTSSLMITRSIDRKFIAMQLAGSVAGLAVGAIGFPFLDFYIGGALASPVAVTLAVALELRKQKQEDRVGEPASEPIPRLRVAYGSVRK